MQKTLWKLLNTTEIKKMKFTFLAVYMTLSHDINSFVFGYYSICYYDKLLSFNQKILYCINNLKQHVLN